MELFASRGIDARVLSTGVFDYARETSLRDVLDGQGLSYRRARVVVPTSEVAGRDVVREGIEVFDLETAGVRVTLMPTASSRDRKSSDPAGALAFLELFEQSLERFRPQILMTFGGGLMGRELIARASRRGIPVVLHIRNFQYFRRDLFENVVGAVVTSQFTARYYAQALGLDCKVIPNPLRADRVVARDPEPQYLTFVNPQSNKGMTVFARIAVELERRRSDVPLLVVEGRTSAENLANVGLDLSGLRSLHRMANTPDPRDFYRVSRAVLVPSLWQESFGRVAAEALANGLPVLATGRGALPETLGGGGFILPVPDRCTPTSGEIPSTAEIEPWIKVIERLWDDPVWETEQRARALGASRRWDEGQVADEYQNYFRSLVTGAPDHEGGEWLCLSLVEEVAVRVPLSPHSDKAIKFGEHRDTYHRKIESFRLSPPPLWTAPGSVAPVSSRPENPHSSAVNNQSFDPMKTEQFDAGI